MDSRTNPKLEGPAITPALARYLDRLEDHEELSPGQLKVLAPEARKGNRLALDLMVNTGLPQVVEIARSYASSDLALMDLIAEGTVGLVKAARVYDERRDGRFPSFARRLVHREIQVAMGA